MTIEEIVEHEARDLWTCSHEKKRLEKYGLAVAKAVVEECAKVCRRSMDLGELYPDEAIRALAAQGPGGGEGR